MARRLEIELTSTRDDGTWTWRAAGARQPKGEIDAGVVPDGIKVGDVVKVEAEASLDGLEVTTVFAPKQGRTEAERLELIGSGDDGPLVTSHLVSGGKGRGEGRDRGDRDGGGRRDRGDRGGRAGRGGGRDERGGRGARGKDDRDKGRDRKRGDRPTRPGGGGRERSSEEPRRPKTKRLKPARVHRKAALEALPEEQRAVADEVLRGGVPGLRQTIDDMNKKAAADGIPKINGAPIVALAERLAPTLKAAEWRDRAEAAVAGVTEVDLRDIRSVVVAADTGARGEDGRALADQLRTGLAERVESEHRKWLDELAKTIADGRTVRALRLSSRPPKAGTPLPPDMAERLAAMATAGLDSQTSQDRWETVLDAVAYSPVRAQVNPSALPAEPNESLLKVVRKLAGRLPHIAVTFGIDPPAPRGARKRRPTPPPPPPLPPAASKPAEAAEAPEEPGAAEAEPAEAVVVEAEPVEEVAVAEAEPVEEVAVAEAEPAPAEAPVAPEPTPEPADKPVEATDGPAAEPGS